MKKIYLEKIPFDPISGNQQGYPQDRYKEVGDEYEKVGPVWKDNTKFFAQISMSDYHRGRSAAGFNATLINVECQDVEYGEFLEGKEVEIFMVDMLEIITKSVLQFGVSNLLCLSFAKRGRNYGLALVDTV